MPAPCKKGDIWRVGYTRKSKKQSKSLKHVSGKCIKARSQTGKKTSVLGREYLAERKKIQELAREKFGSKKCKKGEILREGFRRGSKSGKKVWVPPTCVPAKGKASKTGKKQERLFYLEPGRLAKYGYEEIVGKSDLARHKSLEEAMKLGEKPLSVMRRLNALATLTRNTNPQLSHMFKEDSEWVKLTKEYANRE